MVHNLNMDFCASDTGEASGDVLAAGESQASDNIPEHEQAGVAKADIDGDSNSKTTVSLRFTFIRSGVKCIFSSAPAQQVRVILMLGPKDEASLSTIIP